MTIPTRPPRVGHLHQEVRHVLSTLHDAREQPLRAYLSTHSDWTAKEVERITPAELQQLRAELLASAMRERLRRLRGLLA
jgi:hypothetical protein